MLELENFDDMLNLPPTSFLFFKLKIYIYKQYYYTINIYRLIRNICE